MSKLVKALISLVAGVICSWPLWVFMVIRSALEPVGFWENLAAGILGWWAFGGLQILFLVFWLFLLKVVWLD